MLLTRAPTWPSSSRRRQPPSTTGLHASRRAAHDRAYRSVVEISTTVNAGLLIRQTHHWAADVFIAAITLHLLRVFFTGAYRKPRELTYWIGITILMTALLEGYLGYSLVDDLLCGMGLAIGNGVALSIPFVGANLGALVWGGPFPGGGVLLRACTSPTSSSSPR